MFYFVAFAANTPPAAFISSMPFFLYQQELIQRYCSDNECKIPTVVSSKLPDVPPPPHEVAVTASEAVLTAKIRLEILMNSKLGDPHRGLKLLTSGIRFVSVTFC